MSDSRKLSFEAFLAWGKSSMRCECDDARMEQFVSEDAHWAWHTFDDGWKAALAQQAQPEYEAPDPIIDFEFKHPMGEAPKPVQQAQPDSQDVVTLQATIQSLLDAQPEMPTRERLIEVLDNNMYIKDHLDYDHYGCNECTAHLADAVIALCQESRTI